MNDRCLKCLWCVDDCWRNKWRRLLFCFLTKMRFYDNKTSMMCRFFGLEVLFIQISHCISSFVMLNNPHPWLLKLCLVFPMCTDKSFDLLTWILIDAPSLVISFLWFLNILLPWLVDIDDVMAHNRDFLSETRCTKAKVDRSTYISICKSQYVQFGKLSGNG